MAIAPLTSTQQQPPIQTAAPPAAAVETAPAQTQSGDTPIPADRMANARLGEGWNDIATVQEPHGSVTEGPQLPAGPPPTIGAPTQFGSDAVRKEMLGAGMQNVSDPPTEAELRTYHAQHGPHKDLISQRKYGDAAAAYRKDADKLPEGDPKRAQLEARAQQLEVTGNMEARAAKNGNHVSYPPTWDETKAHFRSLKGESANTVGAEYEKYTGAFHSHVQADPEGSKMGDVKYAPEVGTINGEQGLWRTETPTTSKEVTDDRRLNSNGQRINDCEGYAYMGNELLGEAGFKPANGNAFTLIRPARDPKNPNAHYNSHVMVHMTRANANGTTDDAWVSNNKAFTSPDPQKNARGAIAPALSGLGLASTAQTEMYYGATEREAVIHGDKGNPNYQVKFVKK